MKVCPYQPHIDLISGYQRPRHSSLSKREAGIGESQITEI
jgi:hypothetical protein